jgi:hypothetical protein
LAILDPNAAIEPKFVSYQIELADGRSLTGLIKNETASSIQLMQSGGVAETLLRTQVRSMSASRISLMPEGLEEALSLQGMADLISYLKLGPPALFGPASSEQAATARREFRELTRGANCHIISAAERLDYSSWLGRFPLAHCRQSDGSARVEWEATFINTNSEGSARMYLPVGTGFRSQPQGKFRFVLNNETQTDFDVSLLDQMWQSADGKLKLTYTVMQSNAEDSNGVLLIEAAPELIQKDKPAHCSVIGSAAHSQRWFGIYLVP